MPVSKNQLSENNLNTLSSFVPSAQWMGNIVEDSPADISTDLLNFVVSELQSKGDRPDEHRQITYCFRLPTKMIAKSFKNWLIENGLGPAFIIAIPNADVRVLISHYGPATFKSLEEQIVPILHAGSERNGIFERLEIGVQNENFPDGHVSRVVVFLEE